MDRNILLTFTHIEGYPTFEWFENMEECNEFVEDFKDSILSIFACEQVGNVRDMMEELNYEAREEE